VKYSVSNDHAGIRLTASGPENRSIIQEYSRYIYIVAGLPLLLSQRSSGGGDWYQVLESTCKGSEDRARGGELRKAKCDISVIFTGAFGRILRKNFSNMPPIGISMYQRRDLVLAWY
jgi:hypothetical protein